MNINILINELLKYGLEKEMIEHDDLFYIANKIIDILRLDNFEICTVDAPRNIELILNDILDYACEKGIIENNMIYRDLFDTRIMDCLMPRPSEVIKKFNKNYDVSPKKATEYFYEISKASNYIRSARTDKNILKSADTEYGKLNIAINLSKPEKDPKSIELEKNAVSTNYPKCLLCKENVGFAGNIKHPAKQTLRTVPIVLNAENWYFQYSPYVYYNEHCIIFSQDHTPMNISDKTFKKLVEFTEKFPHYFIGANAGLPIVGGSILSHDHFQGGSCDFPMTNAKSIFDFSMKEFESVKASYLDWPLDVIRLKSHNAEEIIEFATHILNKWVVYDDFDIKLHSHTNDTLHNAITPVVRRRDGMIEIDIALRNNRTDDEHPQGIFHTSEDLYHIKKENIGLIEVLGLAILPARLKDEFQLIKEYLSAENANEKSNILNNPLLAKHKNWCIELDEKYKNNSLKDMEIEDIIYTETVYKFKKILECCSVFKFGDRKKSCERFIASL